MTPPQGAIHPIWRPLSFVDPARVRREVAGSYFCPARDAFHGQHHVQRHNEIDHIRTACGLIEPIGNIAPRWFCTVCRRQIPNNLRTSASVRSVISSGMTSGWGRGRDQSRLREDISALLNLVALARLINVLADIRKLWKSEICIFGP